MWYLQIFLDFLTVWGLKGIIVAPVMQIKISKFDGDVAFSEAEAMRFGLVVKDAGCVSLIHISKSCNAIFLFFFGVNVLY